MKIGTRMPSLEGATDWLNRAAKDAAHGQATLVHFWAVSCEICKEKMWRVGEWRERYADRLRVIAVHLPRYEEDTRVETVREMTAQLNVTELCAVDNEHYLRDAFENEQGYTPAYYLFDAENRLRAFAAGERGVERIAAALERTFEAAPPAANAPSVASSSPVAVSPDPPPAAQPLPSIVARPNTAVLSPKRLPPVCLDCSLFSKRIHTSVQAAGVRSARFPHSHRRSARSSA